MQPLRDYLTHKRPSALVSARSRDQSKTRASLQVVERGQERVKINPLVSWTRERLESYASHHALPLNPLYYEGYLSIGCAPCTRAVKPGEDVRTGRWAGQRQECGLWQGERAL